MSSFFMLDINQQPDPTRSIQKGTIRCFRHELDGLARWWSSAYCVMRVTDKKLFIGGLIVVAICVFVFGKGSSETYYDSWSGTTGRVDVNCPGGFGGDIDVDFQDWDEQRLFDAEFGAESTVSIFDGETAEEVCSDSNSLIGFLVIGGFGLLLLWVATEFGPPKQDPGGEDGGPEGAPEPEAVADLSAGSDLDAPSADEQAESPVGREVLEPAGGSRVTPVVGRTDESPGERGRLTSTSGATHEFAGSAVVGRRQPGPETPTEQSGVWAIAESHALSREHARISLEDGVIWVKDLGTVNGTRLFGPNGAVELEPHRRQQLFDDQVIEVGDVRLSAERIGGA